MPIKNRYNNGVSVHSAYELHLQQLSSQIRNSAPKKQVFIPIQADIVTTECRRKNKLAEIKKLDQEVGQHEETLNSLASTWEEKCSARRRLTIISSAYSSLFIY